MNRTGSLATDATPAIARELRERFLAALHDREQRAPPPGQRIRMLEKTPKNSLRIPFLAAVFPEARFIYLHRDPREVLASMMEAWTIRTLPYLPEPARLDRPALVAGAGPGMA